MGFIWADEFDTLRNHRDRLKRMQAIQNAQPGFHKDDPVFDAVLAILDAAINDDGGLQQSLEIGCQEKEGGA